MAGWAFDPNKKKSPVKIHVYIGGKAGAKGAKGYNIGKAAKRRTDVAKAHKGVGANHGFDVTLKTSKRGKKKVCVYAIDIGPGSNKLLGCKTVGIKAKAGENDVMGTYSPPLVGDFNGDGYTDIHWYQPGSGGGSMWFGTPTKGVFDKGYRNDVKGTYKPPLPGDFNGDGYTDIFFYQPGPGGDSIWYGTASKGDFVKGFTAGDIMGTYSPPLVGDFNGDGYTDIHWYQPGRGGGTMWFGTPTKGVFDKGYRNDVKGTYKPPLPGDYNGDGYSDIFFYKPGPGGDSIWYGTKSKGEFSK